jgi:hypothetical protein
MIGMPALAVHRIQACKVLVLMRHVMHAKRYGGLSGAYRG